MELKLDRFQALEVFVSVAESGGFAAAGRRLSISPPSVTRIISGLEEHLGTALFVRTTRSVGLTEAGNRFLEDSKRLLSDLQEAEEAAVGSHVTPRGELRITAPVLFGGMVVTPILGDYMDMYRQVTARAVFVDRIVNMIDEGLDVAIRIGDLPDSSLIATRVGMVRRVVFAAPDYLERHGTPTHPDHLKDHKLIDPSAIGSNPQWTFRDNGRPITMRLSPRLQINTNDAIRDQVARGWGISRLLSYQIAPRIADGTVVPLLEAFEPPPQPVHVIHQEGRLASAKIRSFVDFMVERLRADPSINQPTRLKRG
jgi:DNA-binding transcriptional LysR family regulator